VGSTKKALQRLVIRVLLGKPLEENYAGTILGQRSCDIVEICKCSAQQHVAERKISLQNAVFWVRTCKLRNHRVVFFQFCQSGGVVALRH
jgi:hypothetical protein